MNTVLIGNAIKFTNEGGVTLRLGTKQNDIFHLRAEVEDTGVDIALEDQKRVFEPFVQLGDQGGSKGTGLGLTITRQFIELMGGHLTLESAPGKGSLFRIDLPIKEARKEDVSYKAEARHGAVLGLAPGQSAYRVLIVEDQVENQLLLTQLMEYVGIDSKIAKDGFEGVELFKTWNPHLIWMDRRMPHMDGPEATKAIRQLPGGQGVKIIAVTASAFMEQRDEMLQAGMDDFICKPYRDSEIYNCLERHLGVKFLYEEKQEAPPVLAELSTEMLASLPKALRADLESALKSLEKDRINLALDAVAQYSPSIHQALAQLVDNFDYPAILKLLGGN